MYIYLFVYFGILVKTRGKKLYRALGFFFGAWQVVGIILSIVNLALVGADGCSTKTSYGKIGATQSVVILLTSILVLCLSLLSFLLLTKTSGSKVGDEDRGTLIKDGEADQTSN